jgi:hypothetical protein
LAAMVATNEKFGSVCFGENELNLKGALINTNDYQLLPTLYY